MTERNPRPSFILWIVSYLILAWAWIVHAVDRVLLFLTPTPKSSTSAQPPSGSSPDPEKTEKEK